MRIFLGILGILAGSTLIFFSRPLMDWLSRLGTGMGIQGDGTERVTTPRIIGIAIVVISILILFGSPEIIAGLIGVGIGVLLVVKSKSIKGFFGNVTWAEEHLGSGGTDSLWKLVGVAVIILSFLWMAGNTQQLFWSVMGQFFGVE